MPKASILYGSALVNNLLEFIGMAVNVWLECLVATANDCMLALGDSASAVGWLHNSSRLNVKWAAHEAHLVVAQKVALLALDAGCGLASQHLQGDLNTVADLLSFAGGITRAGGKRHPVAFDDPPDDIITQRFHLCCSEQMPKNFRMSPLPNKISSWVLSVLQIAASSLTVASKEATSPKTGPGDGGSVSAPKPDGALTLSSLNYPQSEGTLRPILHHLPSHSTMEERKRND
jgi:hypothetical protein